MVKKLLKYEFASVSKTVLPMALILLFTALFTRIVQIFETGGTVYNIFLYSSSILMGIAMLVILIMTAIVCVVRFYRNMFTAEGYLTLTLPVTHREHIWAKLISAVISSVISVIAVIVAFMIATMGDVFNECVKAAAFIIKQMYKYFKFHSVLYGIEFFAALIVYVTSVYLLFYACITVGQTAKKNRVLAAFGVYFGYYVFRQILGTVLIIIGVNIDWSFLSVVAEFARNHIYSSIHLFFLAVIVFFGLLSLAYFAVTKYFLKHKLNIE